MGGGGDGGTPGPPFCCGCLPLAAFSLTVACAAAPLFLQSLLRLRPITDCLPTSSDTAESAENLLLLGEPIPPPDILAGTAVTTLMGGGGAAVSMGGRPPFAGVGGRYFLGAKFSSSAASCLLVLVSSEIGTPCGGEAACHCWLTDSTGERSYGTAGQLGVGDGLRLVSADLLQGEHTRKKLKIRHIHLLR